MYFSCTKLRTRNPADFYFFIPSNFSSFHFHLSFTSISRYLFPFPLSISIHPHLFLTICSAFITKLLLTKQQYLEHICSQVPCGLLSSEVFELAIPCLSFDSCWSQPLFFFDSAQPNFPFICVLWHTTILFLRLLTNVVTVFRKYRLSKVSLIDEKA